MLKKLNIMEYIMKCEQSLHEDSDCIIEIDGKNVVYTCSICNAVETLPLTDFDDDSVKEYKSMIKELLDTEKNNSKKVLN